MVASVVWIVKLIVPRSAWPAFGCCVPKLSTNLARAKSVDKSAALLGQDLEVVAEVGQARAPEPAPAIARPVERPARPGRDERLGLLEGERLAPALLERPRPLGEDLVGVGQPAARLGALLEVEAARRDHLQPAAREQLAQRAAREEEQ